jgi:protein-L-isoaspartate(D-aspartate) O-methyltransferase
VGGATAQVLVKLQKADDGTITRTELAPVTFVPLLSGMVD